MWWEQECNVVTDENALQNQYYFALNLSKNVVSVTQTGTPILPDLFMGNTPEQNPTSDIREEFNYTNGGYRLHYIDHIVGGGGGQTRAKEWQIIRISDNTIMWNLYRPQQSSFEEVPYSVTLNPVSGSDATGTVTLDVRRYNVYARYIMDVPIIGSHTIPDNDIVENNRNYTRVIPYENQLSFWVSSYLETTPTKWGIYQPGLYYSPGVQAVVGNGDAFPVARAAWGRVSLWYLYFENDTFVEKQYRSEFTLKDAYPLWSVISVLLAQIAPGITHKREAEYSQFFYGQNPITGINQILLITPKSNVIASGYDQPAQKAPITLKNVLDMLRECFRCYWYVDAQNRFCIEHISWFMNGGAYPGTPNFPVVGINLTEQIVTRNGKPWSYARNQYKFDKPEMPARYQFGWMDDCSELFEGFPIEIISKFVNPDNIENISVEKFTSDIDYILLNPSEISKDGFALLAASIEPGTPTIIPLNIEAYVTSDFFDLYDLSEYAGQTIGIVVGALSNDLELALANNEDDTIQIGVVGDETERTFTFHVPEDYTRLVAVQSEDCNVLFSEIQLPTEQYRLPYYAFTINETEYTLQNAWVSFMFLQRYYMYDMPALDVEINGVRQTVYGVKKLKTQTIKFPVLVEPNLFNLIKTELGRGTIQKMSVNLLSRNANATLKYDTE
jgi:hypothetical protein